MGKRGGTRSTSFKPGQTIARKPKGPNAKTLVLENFAQTIITGGMEKFQMELMKLHGKDYVNAFMTVFDYVKPKLTRLQVRDDSQNEKVPQVNIYQVFDGKESRINLSIDRIGNEPMQEQINPIKQITEQTT
jgi:hypothetical protein